MTTSGSFGQIFEIPLPENPSLIESLTSWNHIKSIKPIEASSFTEIFGELHLKENLESLSSASPTLWIDLNLKTEIEKPDDNNSWESLLGTQQNQYISAPNDDDGFSSKNSESLQHCSQGIGFERSDDVEGSKNESKDDRKNHEEEEVSITKHSLWDNLSALRILRSRNMSFPPPISCIGRSGKPQVCFKSYRHDGRFILKEIKIPTHKFLHACREDGRLRMRFVQPNLEIPGGGEEDADEREDKGK